MDSWQVEWGRITRPSSRSGIRPTIAAVAAFTLLFTGNAFAYLDPGTGSILLQGLIAGVAAVVTYAGLYWQKVKAFFQRFRRKSEPKGEENASNEHSPE